jgi:hypothetical protein
VKRWLIGLITGGVAGGGTLVAGPIAAMLGGVAVLLAVVERPRVAAIGGVLLGMGGAWLALFGRVALTCRADCASPDLAPWLSLAAIFVGLGALVTVRASRRPG